MSEQGVSGARHAYATETTMFARCDGFCQRQNPRYVTLPRPIFANPYRVAVGSFLFAPMSRFEPMGTVTAGAPRVSS